MTQKPNQSILRCFQNIVSDYFFKKITGLKMLIVNRKLKSLKKETLLVIYIFEFGKKVYFIYNI